MERQINVKLTEEDKEAIIVAMELMEDLIQSVIFTGELSCKINISQKDMNFIENFHHKMSCFVEDMSDREVFYEKEDYFDIQKEE